MSNIQTATCQDCNWTGPVEHTKELRDIRDRVLPGDVMPAGECPEEGCGGAAMLHSERDHDLTADTLMQPVCNTCGGTGVLVDAWAAWHLHAQRWELHSTYEPNAFCADCDGECGYTMKPSPAEAHSGVSAAS